MGLRAMMRTLAKQGALTAAAIAVLPAVASFKVRGLMYGRDRALEGSTQMLALLPGLPGQFLRRAFLQHALDECDASATIEFGTIFSQCGARIGPNAYIGPRCHIGLAHLERDVLVAAGVHVPSGRHTHDISDPRETVRDQPMTRHCVRIGAGAWIGSTAVVMADVGAGTIVGAGAVVTTDIPVRVVAAGVPARVLRSRDGVRTLAG